jgi:iron uptake system EfeUOB component EfeO/EfeM
VRDLSDPKYGARNAYDVLMDFMGNKFAPIPSEIAQHLKGEDRSLPRIGGKPQPPTVFGSIKKQFYPLPAQTARELMNDPDSAPFIAAMIADAMGVSVNTYPGYGPKVHALNQSIYDAKKAKNTEAESRLERVWELIKQQVKDAGDNQMSDQSRAARARAENIANAAIHGESLTFGADGLNPETRGEIKTAFREYYEARANGKKVPATYRQELYSTSSHAKALEVDALAATKGAYTRQFTKALSEGNAEVAGKLVKARRLLGVPPADQFSGLVQSVRAKVKSGELSKVEGERLVALGRKAIFKK